MRSFISADVMDRQPRISMILIKQSKRRYAGETLRGNFVLHITNIVKITYVRFSLQNIKVIMLF